MTRTRNSKHNFRSFVGAAMLIVGSAVLLTYSAAIAWQFHAALNSGAVDCLGLFGSVGLASLHAVRTLVLDHAARAVAVDHTVLLSVVHHILILFFAFLVMLVGIALLPRRAAGVNAPGRRTVSAPLKGDQ